MTNPLLAVDSYKQSHFLQYPPEARRISAYVEARPNDFSKEVLFFGLQAFLKNVLSKPFTQEDIDQAEAICRAHGEPFNREGWEIILKEHGGLFPLEISALEEGDVVPSGVPLIQLQNTDDRFPWLTTWIETGLLRAIWYSSTVATLSFKVKEIIYAWLLKTSEAPDAQVPFKLHDFGARGVSSAESAALGGMAHLVNFAGTDTMEALGAAMTYYGGDVPGYSIPAAEHSTMTSWGLNRERDAFANILDQFAGEGKLVAVVSDSYDLFHAVDTIWGQELKDKVLASKGTIVVRPDSGDPVETPLKVLESLWKSFGGRENAKGFRVLNDAVRVIQGDGMTLSTIKLLVDKMIAGGWSLDNMAFGMGAGLLQKVNRDTLSFAMKANAMQTASGDWVDVNKAPKTDASKASKAGRQVVVQEGGQLVSKVLDASNEAASLLKPVFRNGELLAETTFAEVRKRAQAALVARVS